MGKLFIFCLSFSLISGTVSAVHYYECGLYTGAKIGYALINSPQINEQDEKIENSRGSLAWSFLGGYHYPVYPDLFVGPEISYHDNGSSSLFFPNKNEYRLESKDMELSAVITYLWFPSLWFSINWGAARVHETFHIWRVVDNSAICPNRVANRWFPATTLTLGAHICRVDFTLSWRYIFGNDEKRLSKAFNDRAASVNAFYFGLQLSI